VFYVVNVAWIVIFVMLAAGHYRTARVLAALAIIPGLVALLQAQLTGIMPAPFGSWAWWVLLNLVPVLAMIAFHQDAPPAARRPWLLALPAGYLLVYGPLLALQATGNVAWVPDVPGLCCILVALACLAYAPRAWSRQSAGSGVWSLTLTLLAAVAGAYRIDWEPFAAFPPSARLAVVVGHPPEPGPYVVRVKLPADVKLMPHWHHEDRVYTVMSGVF
jgi:hypothetical protein